MNAGENRLYWWIAAPLGLALLASSGLLMIYMLATLIGPFSVALNAPVAAAERIALWYPPSSDTPQWRRASDLELWGAVFPPPTELVEETGALGELAARRPSLLVVASGERMNRSELAQLRSYVEAGGAALLHGWFAVGAGAEPDTRAMRSWLGVQRVERLTREQSYFAAAGARGPLLAGLLPGQRLSLAARDGVPATSAADAELYWSSWRIAPQAPLAGASARVQLGAGRLVWLAAQPSAAWTASDAQLAQLYRNGADWARGRPSGELLAWPGGAPCAGLLAMDTEDRFQTAQAVAQRARQQSFPMTFLVLAQLALQHPELVAELAQSGEIGSHADVHDGFEGQSPEQQLRRLEAARSALRSLGVSELRGFRPPLESYDANTVRALLDAGFDYMLGDREHDRQAPRLVPPELGAAGLVQIPRTGADDVEILVKRGVADAAQFEAIVLGDLAGAARAGGLYYFSFHTQYFGEEQRLALLERLMRELRERGAWSASAAEIAAWWRAREQLEVRLRPGGPQRLLLDVSNRGARPLTGVALRVYPNAAFAAASAASAVVFGRAPRAQLHAAQGYVDVLLPVLEGGSDSSYTVDWEPAAAGAQQPLAAGSSAP